MAEQQDKKSVYQPSLNCVVGLTIVVVVAVEVR